MSSEGENGKNVSAEADTAPTEDSQETPQKNDAVKSEKNLKEAKLSTDKSADSVEKEDTKQQESKKENKTENHGDAPENLNDKQDKSDVNKTDGETDDKEEEDDDDDDDDENEDKKGVPLLDQPLEQSGTRERKKVQRFNEDLPSDVKESKTYIPTGGGTRLGEIPRIDASISRFKNDDLKLLHRLLYKAPGKTALITKNIKKFDGFDFKKDSEEYNKKIESAKKFEIKQLKSICEMLDLEKKGSKEEIIDRIIEFLMEPKDSGKQVGGGRPKRTAAVRANNRGYSSHDDSYSSDERRASRGGRGKGRRSNLKDESTSESDAEYNPSDVSDDKPRVVKRKRGGRKKADSDEDDASDIESPTSEDSDDEPKRRKKAKKGTSSTNNKVKNKAPPKTRGRKPAADKAATTKKGGRKRDTSEEESDRQEEENASSSEDEPLIKKAKSPQPPTDDEIKKYVKEILDGANLEEITMKTVCKQVYAHYPDFDLAHKKDFIKSTVKSLIST